MKPTKTLYLFLIFLLSFTTLKAQNEKELIDFLHSGTVKSEKNTVRVPVEIWNDLILMKVKINGNNATLMWDNGFSFSGIDNSLVQPYQFRPYKSSSSASATDGNNANVNLNFLVCPTLEIKGITISDTPFIKLDFRTVTLTKDLKIDGILGASVINKLNWKFNFDKNYVEISEKPFAVENYATLLPFKIIDTNNNHVMAIAFNESKTNCQIDFGYNNDVIEINTANAKNFPETDATKTFGPASVSASGLSPIDTIYTIKKGFSWELADKKLNFLPKISFTKASHHIVIGNKIFRNHYNLVINTEGNTVYALSPRSKTNVPVKADKTYGYYVHNMDGHLKIMKINSNPDTQDNDIKLLQEVTSINGKSADDFKDNYSLRLYQKNLLNKQKKMVLKLEDGKEITLTPQPNIQYPFKGTKELW